MPVEKAVEEARESEVKPETESVPEMVVVARADVPVAVSEPTVRVLMVPLVAARLFVKKFVAVAFPSVEVPEVRVEKVP